jgi:hypothetical protein
MPFAIAASDNPNNKVFNVEQAVGLNAPNSSGDVKLVQYMLKHYYGPAAAGIAVDGWIGPITISWIKRFQEDAKKGGANVLVDSRIDRAFGQVASVSKTTYAILLLNKALAQANPSAYSALPQAVPLSPNPKANPYNPKPKTIKIVLVCGRTPPHDVYVCYTDDSVDFTRVTGALTFPPGVPVAYMPLPYGR